MRITNKIPENWVELQNSVARIFTECGFDVQVEKKIKTARGEVEIDVYVIDNTSIPKSVFICECKNWATSVPQEKVHALHSVVQNSGANFGLLISKNGFQSGAYGASENTNISLLKWEEFLEVYKDKWLRNKFRSLCYLFKELRESISVNRCRYEEKYKLLSEDDQERCIELKGYCAGVRSLCNEFMGNISLLYSRQENEPRFLSEYSCYEDYFNSIEKDYMEGKNFIQRIFMSDLLE
ncbi:restriction endonuclease [Clostridium tagluense]|uniref:restriction endonuclease n=1 Tax=Clostridium tagluense TaxID=360422 RepID=UPI001C0C0BFD|nr:restriction endonuclease [Clostridium tagluense]MBU3130557.1 restriction endonuclease [Clostridium tagluense]